MGRLLVISGLALVLAGGASLSWAAAAAEGADESAIPVKVGILLEESDHEQANMFIRTIKMINERRDETIRRLLPASAVGVSAATSPAREPDARRDQRTSLAGASTPASAADGGGERPAPRAKRSRSPDSGDTRAKVSVRLEPVIEFLRDPDDSLEADAKVCQLIESGVRAIFGPAEGTSAQHVQSICDNLEIPHFELRPPLAAPSSPADEAPRVRAAGLSVNLHPPAQLLSVAYADMIHALNWTSFAIVYEHDSSMIKLQDLLRDSPASWPNRWKIKLFRHERQPQSANGLGANRSAVAPDTARPNFRRLFWQVKSSGERNILLDVATRSLHEALKHAQQVGLMTEEYSFLVGSLDLHMVDIEDFKYSRTKISAFSLLQVPKSGAQLGASDTPPPAAPFDESYLERLGVHHPQPSGRPAPPQQRGQQPRGGKHLSRQLVASERQDESAAFSFLQSDLASENELARREMLQSLPASMGLLPAIDRNNEQRLFEFFVEQQERNHSHVRLSTASAVLHDSLLLYLLALHELDPTGRLLAASPPEDAPYLPEPVACGGGARPWPHGSSLVNYLRRLSFRGLTGQVALDPSGLRSDFRLSVIGLAPNIKQIKVGDWLSARQDPTASSWPEESRVRTRANSHTSSYDDLSSRYEAELRRYTKMVADGQSVPIPYTKSASRSGALMVNEILFDRLYREPTDQVDTLVVTSKLSQPYFMLKETPNRLEGNDQFEGYAVDLIHELSKLVNFRYRWQVVADGKYGSKETVNNKTVWNGMIGEIVRGEADLAIVDLTITAQREEAVDFTLPFMNTGISILFKKPTTKVTTLFSFLSPFSSDVWAYVLAAYCGISAILFLVGHLSPYEWANPHPCRHTGDDDQTVLKNQFSLLNSFWFTIGSLMQQGSDLTPRSMSTRTIAGIWYFFTLIMISSYTANLAAFLTVEKVVYPIENVRDLSNQQEIRYGCVESGSTCTFFHDSQIDTYRRVHETMKRHRTFVKSNDEGQKRVGEGKFAFFMESTTIEYIIERECNLTQIGGLIDSKGYGLATSKHSRLKRPYRTLLNEGILHLQETGMLHVLKNRWWKERRGGGTCTDDGKGGGVTELSLANVGGVFVVLLGGLGISFLVAIAEFMWRARRSGSSRDRMCEQMMKDLEFALACKSSTKPIGSSTGRGRSSCRLNKQSSLATHLAADLDPSMLMRPPLIADQQPLEPPGSDFEPGKRARPPKDCDPILMHAMITLLMQQQQEQQEQQRLRLQPREDPDFRRALDFFAGDPQHQQLQHLLATGSSESGPSCSNGVREPQAPPANNNGGPRNLNSQGDGQQSSTEAEYSEQQQRAANQPQSRWIAANSGAGLRRLLFAQQLVDSTMVDESPTIISARQPQRASARPRRY